jgi:hypothetical protein
MQRFKFKKSTNIQLFVFVAHTSVRTAFDCVGQQEGEEDIWFRNVLDSRMVRRTFGSGRKTRL